MYIRGSRVANAFLTDSERTGADGEIVVEVSCSPTNTGA